MPSITDSMTASTLEMAVSALWAAEAATASFSHPLRSVDGFWGGSEGSDSRIFWLLLRSRVDGMGISDAGGIDENALAVV